MRPHPTQDILHLNLNYDAESGEFRWISENRPLRPLLGTVAGTKRRSGYVLIKLRGFHQIGAHRLAWIYVHGKIPNGMEIDHIDGNPRNNAISNLRLATSSQQKINRGVQSNSRARLKGAFYHACRNGKKWRSQIKVGDRLIFLGYFDTAEEANTAYTGAAVKHFGEFRRQA